MRKILICFLSLLLIGGCVKENNTPQEQEKEEEYTPYTQYFESIYTKDGTDVPLLNTMVKLVVYEESRQKEAYDLVFPLLQKYHQYADINYDYVDEEGKDIVNLKKINESYGSEEKVLIDPELFQMLQKAIELSKLTEGYFQPILGHVSDVYDGKFSSFPIENTDPDQEELQKAVACSISYTELDKVLEMNEKDSSVIFHEVPGCEVAPKINLGAFAKGYILDEAYALLKTLDIPFLLDLGSSSIGTHKTNDLNKSSWSIGIRSPFNKLTALYAIGLEGDTCVSTSGDDNRYYFKKNEDGSTTIRHHILNPFTGYSENYYRNITLVTTKEGNGAVLDALSTALFSIEDLNKSKDMIKNVEKYYDIDIAYAFTIPQADNKVNIYCDKSMKSWIIEEMNSGNINKIIVK